MPVIAWPEIEGLNNTRKYTSTHPEILNDQSRVRYRCKVKLHGMNHAVQVHADGRVIPQSRTTELSVENDNAGFAKWVKSHEDLWTAGEIIKDMVVFGEWIGPGVQKGVACSEIPKKCFAVFAARSFDETIFMVEPRELSMLVCGIPDTHVIPWHEDTGGEIAMSLQGKMMPTETIIDLDQEDEVLAPIVERINLRVAYVEKVDPWVEAVFGIKGTGEGLVFYPYSDAHQGYTNFTNLCFKAKGEKHKNIATAKPAQLNAESAASVEDFVNLVLTLPRLEQGATAVVSGGQPIAMLTYETKLTGNFVKWIATDVQKETQDELTASNLKWDQVLKPLSEKARNWYLAQAKGTK